MSGNLTAYAGIESLSNYPTAESLLAYRNARLARYAKLTEFLRSRSAGRLPMSVVEIGSGSSALLYALARKDLLKRAMGIELSHSRIEFAERWKKDDGYASVENVNANFTDVEFGRATWDWLVVIDNTFTYLHPEDTEYPARLLDKARDSLRDDGRILLDFINYAKQSVGFDHRTWSAFAPTDPFSYGLYSMKIADGINETETIFIKRDGSEARKIEKSKVYSLTEMTALLESHGFQVEEVASSLSGDAYVETESDRLVIVARKRD